MHAQPRRIKRAVLLIQLDDGLQMGYDVIADAAEMTIDDPDIDFHPLDDHTYRRPEPTGSFSIHGRFRGMIMKPGMMPDERGLPSGSPAIESPLTPLPRQE